MICGGWIFSNSSSTELPQNVATGFAEVTQDLEGANYEFLLYCGSQVVCGMNYMIICEKTPVTKEGHGTLAVMILHEDLIEKGETKGKFSIISITDIC